MTTPPEPGCCDEYGCTRKHPIGLYLGDFDSRVYAATRMRAVSDHGDGTATFAASEKHDVTRQMRRFIRDNAEWVRAELQAAGLNPKGGLSNGPGDQSLCPLRRLN
jgi:hypothetical protein